MRLDKQLAQDLANDDYDIAEGYVVVSNKLIDTNRWSKIYELVIQDKTTNKYYMDTYYRGATEYQDERPFDNIDPDFYEVVQETVSQVIYKRVK